MFVGGVRDEDVVETSIMDNASHPLHIRISTLLLFFNIPDNVTLIIMHNITFLFLLSNMFIVILCGTCVSMTYFTLN